MQPWQIALIRGLIGGGLAAGLAFFTQLASGASTRNAGIAAGVGFFTYLGLRSGIEGVIDQAAAK
jgi:hypothetical protein